MYFGSNIEMGKWIGRAGDLGSQQAPPSKSSPFPRPFSPLHPLPRRGSRRVPSSSYPPSSSLLRWITHKSFRNWLAKPEELEWVSYLPSRTPILSTLMFLWILTERGGGTLVVLVTRSPRSMSRMLSMNSRMTRPKTNLSSLMNSTESTSSLFSSGLSPSRDEELPSLWVKFLDWGK